MNWKNVLVQVVPAQAPPELDRAIRWAQAELDELEFITLLSSLAQLVDAVAAEGELTHGG